MADIKQLIEQLTNNDAKIRDAARAALVAMGSPAVDPLIAALNSPSDWQRKSVISLLQQIQDKRVIPPLLNALNDTDPYVRGFAALGLAAQQEHSALPTIQKMIEAESDAFGRTHLLNAVDQLGERQWVIAYANRILTESAFTNKDRQAVIQVIVRMNDPATADLLLSVFRQGEPGVSGHALQGLRNFKDQRAVDILIEQLKDKTPHKRAAAAVELGNFGDPRAVEPIKALLGDKATAWEGDRPGEPSTSVGQAAQSALKKLSTASSSPSAPSAPSDPKESKKPRWKFW